MKLNYQIFITIFALIEVIICDTRCEGSSNSVSNCENLLSEEEKEKQYHCCLFIGSIDNNEINNCIRLKDDEYNQIETTKSQLTEKGYSNVEIDCKSQYQNLRYFFIFILIALNI